MTFPATNQDGHTHSNNGLMQ